MDHIISRDPDSFPAPNALGSCGQNRNTEYANRTIDPTITHTVTHRKHLREHKII